MPYSDEWMEAARYNPNMLRQYFWRAAKGQQALAREYRRKLHSQALSLDEREDKRHQTQVLDRVSSLILTDLDGWVRFSIERPPVCDRCKHRSSTG